MEGRRTGWRLLTNHAYVLISLSEEPGILIRDLAQRVGITERATQSILKDLADEGYVVITRRGRRNSYEIKLDASLRHPLYGHITVAQLISALAQVPDA